MPTYRVTQTSFIGHSVVEPGAIVEYEGEPGPNLELVEDEDDKPAKPAKAKAEPKADLA